MEKAKIKRRHDAERTREALMAAATELFAERGFDGTTVDMISTKAKVNKALVSYYFGGKEYLYGAIVAETFGAAAESLRRVFESTEPADVRLREFVRTFVSVATKRPSFAAMLLREIISGGQRIPDELGSRLLWAFSGVRGIVEQGVRDGIFRPVDPFVTHLSIVGTLVFYLATSRFRERMFATGKVPATLPTTEEYVKHIQDLVTRGLAADRAETTESGREHA